MIIFLHNPVRLLYVRHSSVVHNTTCYSDAPPPSHSFIENEYGFCKYGVSKWCSKCLISQIFGWFVTEMFTIICFSFFSLLQTYEKIIINKYIMLATNSLGVCHVLIKWNIPRWSEKHVNFLNNTLNGFISILKI